MAVRFVWNIAGFSAMRKSAPVEKLIRRHVEAIAAACGEGFEAKVTQGKTRVRGTVVTATPVAMVRNARDNTLVNNLGAGS
ncbi:hypothetical protein CH296_00395 [Rhodococcus sp. 14-2496-1d]|uniref:hypothetical protein n=1 Tax=Rhodococcus sp. 14-2496-1d TaxID=2023146 RepID=UPI000B9AB58C|nr:hypothetical protein [Rhodococcus sp. 14-2496-1d]OZF40751.1 hypothetical protein CH296_00395 [Rhodococcus sp. 14-2496-1d]